MKSLAHEHMTDDEHNAYIAEMAAFKDEERAHTCDIGDHNWRHCYGGAYCSLCGIDEDDYLRGNHAEQKT